jgi:hypothetical protein
MKGKPVDQLVYEYLFPKRRPTDPQNFATHLQCNLVPEVRQEVHTFFGHLDTPEAKYPGLDYTHRTHRIRLSRWPWHRRLFRAFDGLGLTSNEIAGLTKWEGTKWAKERYEKEQGITIVDTTDEDISPSSSSARRSTLDEQSIPEPGDGTDETMAEDSDEELASVGFDLNQRLRERVALRDVSGDMSMVIDEEWERWLKDAIETGQLPEIASRIYRATGDDLPEIPPRQNEESPARATPPRATSTAFSYGDPASLGEMMTAARDGRWDDVPERYHAMLQGVFEDDTRSTTGRATPPSSGPARATWQFPTGTWGRSPLAGDVLSGSVASRAGLPPQLRRQHWSNLRLPSGEGNETPEAGWLGLLPGA